MRGEFARVGEIVDEQIDVYIIGGASLLIHGFENEAPDLDLLTPSEKDFNWLCQSLERIDYTLENKLESSDKRGSFRRFVNAEGRKIDIFNQQTRDFILSNGVQSRSRLFYQGKKLMQLFAVSKTFSHQKFLLDQGIKTKFI